MRVVQYAIMSTIVDDMHVHCIGKYALNAVFPLLWGIHNFLCVIFLCISWILDNKIFLKLEAIEGVWEIGYTNR